MRFLEKFQRFFSQPLLPSPPCTCIYKTGSAYPPSGRNCGSTATTTGAAAPQVHSTKSASSAPQQPRPTKAVDPEKGHMEACSCSCGYCSSVKCGHGPGTQCWRTRRWLVVVITCEWVSVPWLTFKGVASCCLLLLFSQHGRWCRLVSLQKAIFTACKLGAPSSAPMLICSLVLCAVSWQQFWFLQFWSMPKTCRRWVYGKPWPADLLQAKHKLDAVADDVADLETLADQELRAGFADFSADAQESLHAYFEDLRFKLAKARAEIEDLQLPIEKLRAGSEGLLIMKMLFGNPPWLRADLEQLQAIIERLRLKVGMLRAGLEKIMQAIDCAEAFVYGPL